MSSHSDPGWVSQCSHLAVEKPWSTTTRNLISTLHTLYVVEMPGEMDGVRSTRGEGKSVTIGTK